MTGVNIEQGYFVFTLMPSLRCDLNCPHCYLTLDQRRNSPTMTVKDLTIAAQKVDHYYQEKMIKDKTIVCYWYGGEPTQMGQEYFIEAAEAINTIFSKEKGYTVKHTVLSSLILVDPTWFPIFDKYGHGEVQSSFDGLMRGKGYMKRWEKKVKEINDYGLKLSTISVVNHELIQQEPEAVLDYLSDHSVQETSWLPFMWNEQNDGDKYEKFAPRMDAYDAFMIRLTEQWIKRREESLYAPEIGQMRFILSQSEGPAFSNIAGQTLFLLPEGEMVLPDYKNKWQEFMQPFGNILNQSFEEILRSPERQKYLKRQIIKNRNPECFNCEHSNKCLIEFWKENRPGDDCFGAKKYVEWVLENKNRIIPHLGEDISTTLY